MFKDPCYFPLSLWHTTSGEMSSLLVVNGKLNEECTVELDIHSFLIVNKNGISASVRVSFRVNTFQIRITSMQQETKRSNLQNQATK